jgi:hypothetical protein
VVKKKTEKLLPYLAAAIICENLIEDKDGNISAIGIIDTITVPKPEPSVRRADSEKQLHQAIQMKAIVA